MDSTPLIVGAGPVGLAAALFLSHRGVTARIIEADHEPHPITQSRALAVNPRTLDLLEHTGVSARMLERGGRLNGASFRRGDRLITAPNFSDLRHRRPFMLALSQAVSERLLEEALAERGVRVERGARFTGCREQGELGEATIERNGETETVACPWILGADGARSAVRSSIGADFPGSKMRRTWRLADVALRSPLARDRAFGYLLEGGGFLALIPVVTDIRSEPAQPIWRLITDRDDPIAQLRVAGAEAAAAPVWESSFQVSHRLTSRFQHGRVYLAGDASHIHSPIGARGMNLGIEDAYVFAELAARGELSRYENERRRVDAGVVRRVRFITRLIAGESPLSFLLRTPAPSIAMRIGPVRRRLLQTVSGLDHEMGIAPL